MLAYEVIRELQSEWYNLITVVPKRDQTMHLCIDFRKVNHMARFDVYPMSRVEDLEKIRGACFISTLDLSKGYWQIPMEEHAQEKVAFATPWGLYKFMHVPFGLHGAVATFQRLMDKVLSPYQDYEAAYIDDVVV
ncbi:hypothetical protein Y1Q_0017692 [Alligator mississippiensis]|uniref:ribonuclease H n=1 Tax=Alligator mississippiensis TaxID=8496 RepID=A0A151LYA9_ALLMI|nr:hypothetical protein Y1Q_0017692 [Alligator mississippiensis]